MNTPHAGATGARREDSGCGNALARGRGGAGKGRFYLAALFCMAGRFFLSGCCAQGIPGQDFENTPAESLISSGSVAGWAVDRSGGVSEAAAIVSGGEGAAAGKILRLAEPKTVVVYQTGEPLWTSDNGPGDFKMDFFVAGKMPFDITLHNGTTSAGMYVSINHRTNQVSVSQGGGESVYQSQLSEYPVPDLKDGTWYTLKIQDLLLSKAAAEPAAGKLCIYEKDNPSNILLDGISIKGAGKNPFSTLKTFQVRRWGDKASYLDVDNVGLASAAH